MHRTEGTNFDRDSEGRAQFKDGPPGTTIPAPWLNSVQEEVCNVVEGANIQLKNAANDTNTQLYDSILRLISYNYDFLITSQSQFNDIVEKVAANQYKIKDEYRSIYMKYLISGYQMSGVTSPLSGGDTWGYLETNNCGIIYCESGAFIDFENTQGYLKANTDDSILYNVNVQGAGTVASAVTRSFLLDANRVIFLNCKCSNRLSVTTLSGFEGSATAIHNQNSKYVGCSAYELDSSGAVQGFYLTENLTNCLVYDIESSAVFFSRGYSGCYNLSNCIAKKIDGDANSGFYNSNRLINCLAEDLDGLESNGFYNCDNLSSCYAYDLQSTSITYGFRGCNQLASSHAAQLDGVTVSAFYTCNQISACYANDIDGSNAINGFNFCTEISACKAFDIVSTTDQGCGFRDCDQISACYAQQIDSSGGMAIGYNTCDQISACYANDIDVTGAFDAIGFHDCTRISACQANDIDSSGANAYGFDGCTYGSSLYTAEAANPNCDWMNTNDANIVNKFSCPAVFT